MSVARTDPLPDPPLTQQEDGQVVPYAPSFIDRLTDFIQRLPIPYALTYLLLFLLESAAILAVSWIDGSLTLSRLDPIVFLFPLWLWGPLAFVTYLDSLSLRSLSEFGPLLDMPPATKGRLEYEFTTMPSRGVLISAVGWSGVYLLFWVVAFAPSAAAYGNRALATWFWFLVGFVSFAVGGVIYYHTVRQLRLVSRTVRMVRQFDLFALDPVYAFSVLTARTGMAWVALITLTLLISPLAVGGIAEWSTLILQIALAMAAFLLPLRIVNRRLVSEKRGQLAELDQRVKATLARVNKAVDDNSLEQVSKLNDALKALTSQREILARIPTWPWRPGLFAGFVSIIVLPVVLFLLQFALGRWLDP
ncbi:MAG TPA: hypothetical protein VLD63_11370 [Anaerolineales bacterium]|nr:hypothetical protein [Anaerolineales bacterium]